jgi:hypothetical protein
MRAPSAESGVPVARAARSGALMPARSSEPTTDPAEVPTMISASRGSQPVASARAERTPAWKAWPTTPPAPSTTPILAMAGSYLPLDMPSGCEI